ncbi:MULTISPECIES: hypothetical protein [unclassified Afipia]|nr:MULTISPECIES: hypothetical protein [unclassified Afipia]
MILRFNGWTRDVAWLFRIVETRFRISHREGSAERPASKGSLTLG